MSGSDGWSAVPARDPGHGSDAVDGQEARRASDRSAGGVRTGRVHGRPAPQYGEYAPDGWVNPVLAEQERVEQEQRSRELRQQAAQEAVQGQRSSGARPDRSDARVGPSGASQTAAPTSRFGASPLDFAMTVGLVAMGFVSVVQALSVGTVASKSRAFVEQHYTELADPSRLTSMAVVRAIVIVVAFGLVAWLSVRRLRARRWTFWIPLVGGVVASVLGAVPLLIVIFQDPNVAAYFHRLGGR